MDFSESLALGLNYKTDRQIFINEGSFKSKPLNKSLKIGKSFQYNLQTYPHRFIIWCIDNNVVTISEYSTDCELLGHQIEIEFEKSQILNMSIFENDQAIEFLVSTSFLVVRFSLHHPSKLRQPNKEGHQYSIFYDVTELNEIKHFIHQQIDITNITSVNSFIDSNNNDAYFNYAMSNGSIFTTVVASSANNENALYFEMRETSLLSKIFSGFIPRQRSIEYTDISILDMTYVEIANLLYLVTISKDNKIKIWNLKDRSCIVSEDLLSCVLESNGSNRSLSTINHNSIISSHKIKSFHSNTNINDFSDTVVVYFHTIIGKEILSNWIVVRITDPNDKTRNSQPIQICCNVNNAGDNMNLLDFEIGYNMKTNNVIGVWSLTSKSNGAGTNCTHSLSWIPLTGERKCNKVSCRLYNATNELELSVHDNQDPKESIMTKIFSTHQFSRMAVINTLNRYIENNNYVDAHTILEDLKFRLVMIVDAKVEKQLAIYLSQDSDIDMMELNKQQWHNIYQEMVEEHFSVMEPLCLVSTSGTIGLHRYGTISLMRRANGMEQILSDSADEHLRVFFDENSLKSGSTLLKHIHDMSTFLQSIDAWPMIENRLFLRNESPLEICHELSSSSFDALSLSSRFDNQPHLLDQTLDLLEKLDIESIQELLADLESCSLSSLSMGMIHYSSCQVVRDRICTSIALLTMLAPRSLNSTPGGHLSNIVSRIVNLIKSLLSVFWMLTIHQKSSPELTDVQKSQLGSLNLLENRCENSEMTDVLCIRVLQLLQSKFKVNSYQNHTWQSKMSEEMALIVNYLNPNSDSFPIVPICKYFFSYNMPIELIEYLKIITQSEPKGWWEGDECLVNVMIGLAYLLLNKPWKSVEYFIEYIKKPEISSSLLPEIILDETVRSNIESLLVLQAELFIKIIDVMDYIVNPQAYIITLAEAGIKTIDASVETNDKVAKYKSILMTSLFKNLLDLKKYDEARDAIVHNPDIEKQKDCLRQFIMVLCDQRQLEKLVHFNYNHLNEEFVSIVSSRARVSDLSNANDPFYNVLYSFHFQHGDMKAAATCQLELALQLDNEMKNQGPYMENSIAIMKLQNQLKAYLTCITVSTMLPIEDQLFVFPAKLTEDFTDSNSKTLNVSIQQIESKLNSSDHEMDICDDKTVEEEEEGTERNIINLSQIRRQYNLIKTRLKILRESPEHGFIQSGKITPALTLASLLEMGFYWDAIKICVDFKLDLGSLVSTIAIRCAQISKNCLDRPVLKEKENVIDSLEMLNKDIDFASFGSLSKLLWKLLSEVLCKYDTSPCGDLYIKASSKLLSSGIWQLPSWLIDVIVARQSHGSLIRLYISNGYIEPAVNLACRMLSDRIDEMNSLKEQYEHCGVKSGQISWCSYPIVLHLLDILATMNEEDDSVAKHLFDRLNDKCKTMLTILQIDTRNCAIGSI